MDHAKGIERVLKEVRAYFDKTEFDYHGTTEFKEKRLSLRCCVTRPSRWQTCMGAVWAATVSSVTLACLTLLADDRYVYKQTPWTDQEKAVRVKYSPSLCPNPLERYEEASTHSHERLAITGVSTPSTQENCRILTSSSTA